MGGKTQERLSEILGVSLEDLAAIESGEKAAPLGKIPMLAEALGVHPAALASPIPICRDELVVARFIHMRTSEVYNDEDEGARRRIMMDVARALGATHWPEMEGTEGADKPA